MKTAMTTAEPKRRRPAIVWAVMLLPVLYALSIGPFHLVCWKCMRHGHGDLGTWVMLQVNLYAPIWRLKRRFEAVDAIFYWYLYFWAWLSAHV